MATERKIQFFFQMLDAFYELKDLKLFCDNIHILGCKKAFVEKYLCGGKINFILRKYFMVKIVIRCARSYCITNKTEIIFNVHH